ncbi:MAG: efflux RND transporter periplasmic adaptor subunit [Isosphaeraceae bacterium]|nr:efflux RND transporter periplasmic adaptor subunit [Isosphaeraceae bacterium]
MGAIARASRRLSMVLLAIFVGGAGLLIACRSMGITIPMVETSGVGPFIDRAQRVAIDGFRGLMAEKSASAESVHHGDYKIVVTSPKAMDVTVTERFVCQIHSRRNIEVCAIESGYLGEVLIKEGQSVKKGDLMFRIVPTLFEAKLAAEAAEAQLAELEFSNAAKLAERNVVSPNEVKLLEAKLSKAKAKVKLAQAELDFTNVVAPFDGIVDRIEQQLGSLIAEGDVLTTLSDNEVMWVYFNVPEARYLEYMGEGSRKSQDRIELMLAHGRKFEHEGSIGAIEAKFNNETGNIAFRADFPNPQGLLRHGQTGTVLLSRVREKAVVIPQRATFELLDRRYVFVLDEKNIAHRRLITVDFEKDDIFVIREGLTGADKIVLEGVREVSEGAKLEYEFHDLKDVLDHQKFHAE